MSICGCIFISFSETLPSDRQVETILDDFGKTDPIWRDLIGRSYLPDAKNAAYLELLDERWERLGIGPKNS